MPRVRRPRSKQTDETGENSKTIRHPTKIKVLESRNFSQQKFLEAIQNNTLTIGSGPAGTGKTILSVYEALKHHFNKSIGMKRIIISRPALEAGEKIGYLPGELEDKLDPYMRPVYDALYDITSVDFIKEKVAKEHIEIAPIGFLRGRTFKNCFVILDEAQNATFDQLKMVVTRIGENCKMVITGDPRQSDLQNSQKGSLVRLINLIKNVPDVSVVEFSGDDVVRSSIVVDLVKAFENGSV